MFSEQKPTTHKIVAEVVPRPEFVGSLHDSAMARSLGYPDALVPGIDLYAYLARLSLATWGAAWLSHGTLASSSLRPVYHGDALLVYSSAARVDSTRRTVDLAVHNASGAMVATGVASMGQTANQAPGIEAFEPMHRAGTVPPGDPSSLHQGMRFSSVVETVSAQNNARQVAEFLETSDLYVREGIIHPAYLQRMALRNAHASFAHATPPIYVSAACVNLSPARVGEQLDVSGRIDRLWERKGHHYMESEQLVTANSSRAVMLIKRTTIYQARRETTDAMSAEASTPNGGTR